MLNVLETSEGLGKTLSVPEEEFRRRQRAVWEALRSVDLDIGFVFSDQHYNGDVPYLGGNTNITIEQVAGVLGPDGFHIVAGLEGGYVAEQLAHRAGARVHKIELLQLADEKYPIRAERLEDVLNEAAGKRVQRVGLMTPRQVIPDGIIRYLGKIVGEENVVDAQELYYRIKYEKSGIEMALTIRGIGDYWNDEVIPDPDYIVVENTLGKSGTEVETFNRLPLNVQSLFGRVSY